MLRAVTSVVLISGFLIGSQVGAQELSEARVKELVAEGLGASEIARRLGVSRQSVYRLALWG